jgi:two-component system OmpR family response regulator
MTKRHVLFVDDDMISRIVNCSILREYVFSILEASSFSEACRMIERTSELAALVTDIDLGSDDDGFEVARRARATHPDLPVIYMSGTDFARFDHEGVQDSRFVPKPFDPNQIARALDDVSRPEPARAI